MSVVIVINGVELDVPPAIAANDKALEQWVAEQSATSPAPKKAKNPKPSEEVTE